MEPKNVGKGYKSLWHSKQQYFLRRGSRRAGGKSLGAQTTVYIVLAGFLSLAANSINQQLSK